MLRATAFVPWINGCRAAVEIDGERYMDGGLVNRTPLDIIPEGGFDELWIAVCSPSGKAELTRELSARKRRERLVVITPGVDLPAGRWTMDWASIGRTIEIGREDVTKTLERVIACNGNVVHGCDTERLERKLG